MSRVVDKFWFRQIFVLLVACLHSLSAGVMVAFPSVLNPALLSPNSTDITADRNQASWIASINGLSGIVGFFILSPIFQSFGRKAVNITLNVVMFVGWITLATASNVTMLFIARAIQGLTVGGVFIAAVTLSEYSTPRRRGYFMTLKKISIGLGSLTCHTLALFCTWRQIAGICVIPISLAILFVLLWPESPSYLAMKGRFDECEKAFIWLNGNSLESKMELKELINAQMEQHELKKKTQNLSQVKKFFIQLNNREMLKACFIVALVTLCIDACGRYFLLAYLTQILEEITGSNSIAMYGSIVSDLLLISALAVSCLVIRLFDRRTLLFGLGSVTIFLMFIISIAVFTKSNFNFLSSITWLIPCLILLHSFIASVGIIPVAFTISAEVFPLEHRGLCSCISGVAFTIFYAATLKLTPLMIEHTGVSGTYTIYALIVTFCLAILFVILPETKDKTLQQIENEMKGKSDKNGRLLTN
ncbi:PREDICTED: monosaccharide-sensing protein 1-like [Papilio polytes]|uniref:monosaccharide-sensing protein 1-like n=1 Tax=Papilio polytes TaxID=76194 RepID=UPI000676424E|nr:PREDICTED: monosaccharide-sensing protein 1-like [Papilio polytes]